MLSFCAAALVVNAVMTKAMISVVRIVFIIMWFVYYLVVDEYIGLVHVQEIVLVALREVGEGLVDGLYAVGGLGGAEV